jgi:hypothetical protein
VEVVRRLGIGKCANYGIVINRTDNEPIMKILPISPHVLFLIALNSNKRRGMCVSRLCKTYDRAFSNR